MRQRWIVIASGVFFFIVSFVFSFSLLDLNQSDSMPHLITEIVDPDQDQSGGKLLPTVEIVNVKETLDSDQDIQLYIGVFNEHIAIFQGQPNDQGVVKEITGIAINKMPEFEMENLKGGIPFDTDEEKYSILEGLHFPQ